MGVSFDKLSPCAPQASDHPIPTIGKSAALLLVTPTSTIRLGSTFTVDLSVNPSGTPINLVYAALVYPTSSVKLMTKDESMSPFAIHLNDPSAENVLNEIMQVQPNPGIDESSQIARFTFVALRPGAVSVSVVPSSSVLANDGYGTNVLGSTTNLRITILPRL